VEGARHGEITSHPARFEANEATTPEYARRRWKRTINSKPGKLQ